MVWPDLSTALAFSCLIGTCSAYIAHRRGRSPYAWFFVGVLFGLLGIFAIFFAPAKKKLKAVSPLPPEPEAILAGPADKFWYYLDPTHQQVGPMSFEGLKKIWKEGKISPTTYVWNEELSNWKPLQEFIRFN